MLRYRYIDSRAGLDRLYQNSVGQDRIAVDLEADSMHHFKEKICLIQIADQNGIAVVDPLAIDDLSPVKALLEKSSIQKVFHGGDFDIRSLDRDFGIKVNNIFDTEIACRFIPKKERGLATLLAAYFGINLDKKFQKYDWSKRPLPREMISYCINDVAYLVELSCILEAELRKKGRLSWAAEEFEIQSNKGYEKNNAAFHFLKFKGAGKMDRRTLGVLENLLEARIRIAEQKDLPLFKIVGSKALAEMAYQKPGTFQALKKSGILSIKQFQMYGRQFAREIQKARRVHESSLPSYPKNTTPELSSHARKNIKTLKQLRARKSRETGIEEGILMNNAIITQLARENSLSMKMLEHKAILRQWQLDFMGRDIVKAVNNNE